MDMAQIDEIPTALTVKPEGDYTVASPTLPELITEGGDGGDHSRPSIVP
jgi:hypothetical protein